MATGGTNRTVYSEMTMKGASVSAIQKALTNANAEAIKADPTKKKKGRK